MLPTHDLSHIAEAVDLLIAQFKEKPVIEGVLSSWVAQVQDLEDALWQILESRNMSGEGDQLDNLGALVGESRDGRTDEFYRPAIAIRILTNKSNGSPDEILAIAAAVAKVDGIPEEFIPGYIQYQEYPNAAFRITTLLSSAGNRALVAAVRKAKSAGVRFDFVGNGTPGMGTTGLLITYDHTDPYIATGLGFAHTSGTPDNASSNVESY